jgi:uncharacterized protein YgbK (DUF1537 family)
VLVYATADLADLSPAEHRERDSTLIEQAIAELTVRAVAAGVRQVVVAGGETSGAVTSALGVGRLRIGPTIVPGVVWSSATTTEGATIALALKSGNFGSPSFFVDAWSALT